MAAIMVDMGQPTVRRVQFSLPGPGPGIELTGLREIIRRGGRREFASTQRLGFDMVYLLERGSTVHVVDLVPHELGIGEALWVRAGQVHRWGDISTLEGRVAMFPSHVIPPEVQQALTAAGYSGSAGSIPAWTADQLRESGAADAWRALHADDAGIRDPAARSLAREAAVSAVLLRLAAAAPDAADRAQHASAGGPSTDRHRVFASFQAEVDARFRSERLVADYARRLGWSTKTLVRAAAEHGTTPKAVIDDRIVLEARRLLVHTQQPVADIAAELGFDDASNFSTSFRLRTGETPGAFRAGAAFGGR
ncbi:AraC family transcriptional regulator [Clavibacter phaseoli]|nr:AraC family transcriptional regulator [Clavibacter phaseoli]